jgi:hypothetical protein
MRNYLKTPDQFFYAQYMLITFAAMWALVPNIKTPAAEWATILLASLFILLSAPYGYSNGRNSEIYRSRGDVNQNVHKACQGSQITKSVEIDIYPSEPWSLKAERSLVCE